MTRGAAGRNGEYAGLVVAGAAAGLWLWTNFCGFPWSSWNDVRLAPVFMARLGESVYSPPGEGILTTWMYGPVPLWLWWPATLAKTASAAILSAGALNLGITVIAIAIVCLAWPLPGITRTGRALAFLATLTAWPHSAFHYLQADNLVVALGLVGNTFLVRRHGHDRGATGWWIAAATAAALGSKQTSLGLLVAQVAWLWSERDRSEAWHHLLRTAVLGAVIAVAAARQFGAVGLWWGMVTIPSHLPWTDEPGHRLWDLLPLLIVHLGVPALLLAARGRVVLAKGHPLRLPLFAWLFSLPLGLLGMMTAGGTINSLQGFVLLLPPLLLVACRELLRWRWFLSAACASILLAVIARWTTASNRPLRPLTAAIDQAAELCRRYPHQVWFPWNPLITYFADGRFYHAEDGLYVRRVSGFPISPAQFARGLPRDLRLVALNTDGWGLALGFTTGHEQPFGLWRLYEWKPSAPR